MQILTIVIGIIFVLLLLSLLATTIMELLSSILGLRGRNLTKALRNMLASSDPNETLVDDFQRNSLYRHLTQQYGSRTKSVAAPSYMSAETFQSILLDIILKGDDMSNLEARLDSLPDEDLRNVLKQLLRESGGQTDLFRLEVQNWYNNVMDRAAGWYKRYTQKILLFMGMGIAVLFNADTVALYDRLSNDPETLNQLAMAAEQYVQARDYARTTTVDVPGQRTAPTQVQGPAPAADDPSFGNRAPTDPFDTAATATPYAPAATQQPAPATYLYTGEEGENRDFRESLEDLKSLLNNEIAEIRRPLGLGWEGVELSKLGLYEMATKFLGFVLTALAISMGAPFWFDLLKKLVNIRSTGARPYE
ncbi:MAG: hypothetical protein ACJAZ9_001020 [Neolewinella sp.]|jgi:hypothetical protein